MMNKLSAALILIFIVGGFTADSQQKIATNFIPPLNIAPVVSGTFGELRSNHFHTGLDLATNGVIGLPVVAIEDGFVSRIKVSGTGYGKALYIDHDNGYTSVYAHLEEYSPSIDSIALDHHYKNETFEFDLKPDGDKIKVKKGQTIGYAGNSGGSGGPHLHFEIRETRSEKALNPLMFYTHIKDNIPPSVRRIRVYPLNDQSSVNGKNRAQTFNLIKGKSSYYIENEAIVKVSGKIGLGIDAIDRFPGSNNNCGVYSVIMYLNQQKHFKSEVNKLDFDEIRYVNSHVDYAHKSQANIVIQKSFLDPNNQLSIYNLKVNEGEIEVEKDSIYHIKYEVLDAHGNTSIVNVKLKGVEVAPSSTTENKDSKLAWNQNYNLFDDTYNVKIDKGSFYKDVDFDVTVLPKRKTDSSARVKVGDRTIPSQKAISIALKVPENMANNNKYLTAALIDDTGKMTYAGGLYNDGWLNFKTRDLGVFVLAIDSISPFVGLRNIPENSVYTNKKTLELTITDNLSGIASYRCEIDGNWTLFEHDPKQNRLVCYLSKAKLLKNKKKHKLLVTATDRCGNSIDKSFSFVY